MKFKTNNFFTILILIVLIILLVVFLGKSSEKHTEKAGVYSEPGICPYCETKLEKTVMGLNYTGTVVWYCPNPDCEH